MTKSGADSVGLVHEIEYREIFVWSYFLPEAVEPWICSGFFFFWNKNGEKSRSVPMECILALMLGEELKMAFKIQSIACPLVTSTSNSE